MFSCQLLIQDTQCSTSSQRGLQAHSSESTSTAACACGPEKRTNALINNIFIVSNVVRSLSGCAVHKKTATVLQAASCHFMTKKLMSSTAVAYCVSSQSMHKITLNSSPDPRCTSRKLTCPTAACLTLYRALTSHHQQPAEAAVGQQRSSSRAAEQQTHNALHALHTQVRCKHSEAAASW